MNVRTDSRLRSRWWLVLALAAIGIVTAVILVLRVLGGTSGGAASPEEAVASYVDAVNRNDADALRRLSPTSGPTLDAGIQRRLATYGGRHIRLDSRNIQSGAVPHQASALLIGVMSANDGSDQPYEERLYLNRSDDRWYVNLHDVPPATGTPPLPTANIRPAG
jgi:hypothetical protein